MSLIGVTPIDPGHRPPGVDADHRAPPLEARAEAIDILIVDDNPSNIVALAAILEPLGQNIVRASSGTEALHRLLEQDFALTLLDIQMPILDGLETARLVRARARSRHMPIIFLTAFGRDDAQVARAYEEFGAVDFLFKPLVPFILRAKVQAFVDLHRKMLEIERQAALLRDSQQREHVLGLAEATLRWDAERLREEVAEERKVASALALIATAREHAEEALRCSNCRLTALIDQLSVRNEQLADADRRKDEFLAMLAHELRNPLAPIVTAIEILGGATTSAAMRERALGALDRQSRHMVRLVDDLLDVSRITTGKIELRRARVSVASIVNHAIQTSAPHLERSKHSLECSLPEEDITLYADATRLSQVVSNLLNNAAKYSAPGSEIRLDAEREGDEVVLRVQDHGIGIRPELLGEVFVLFAQFDRTTERAQGGLGIGLTLVKRLVELHGGAVSAFSAGLGEGSQFSVRLPVAPPLGRDPAAPLDAVLERGESPAPAPERSRYVLIVEDNDDIRDTMRDMVVTCGHHALTADDGPSGVEQVLSRRPDIAFIDIGLPRLNGYEVASALRARAPDLRTRLVALTGYGRPEDRARALAAGFDDHVVKPATLDELLRLIEQS